MTETPKIDDGGEASPIKPIGRKNYGSIGHLPCSRMGPADHAVHPGMQKICTEKARDRHDVIIVTEKVDGSNVGIARVGNDIHALVRRGYLARTSGFAMHRMFADWVDERKSLFLHALKPGQRLVGEWLAQAHGSIYLLPHGPFVAFDLMEDASRAPFSQIRSTCASAGIPMPKLLHIGGPMAVEKAMELHGNGDHGLVDDPEGAVWRVERNGKFDFMAKWVRPDKQDGKYLPGITGSVSEVPVWNWQPCRIETARSNPQGEQE